MSLPLTLAVLDGMVVTVADQTLVVPLTAIVETLQPKTGDVHALGGDARVIAIRGGFMPLIDVGQALGYRADAGRSDRRASRCWSKPKAARARAAGRRHPRPAPGGHQEPRGQLPAGARHRRRDHPGRRPRRADPRHRRHRRRSRTDGSPASNSFLQRQAERHDRDRSTQRQARPRELSPSASARRNSASTSCRCAKSAAGRRRRRCRSRPSYVRGVINLRGAVLPIVDLAARLGFAPTEPTPRHVIIVVQIGAQLVGLLVDAVSDILTVDRRPDPADAGRRLRHGQDLRARRAWRSTSA